MTLTQLRRAAYDEAGPLPAVALRPADAIGHVLREAVDARSDLPPYEVVATDGWAVAGPGPWQLVAASPADAIVPDGCAVVVEAGLPLPPGTSGVVAAHDGEILDARLHARVLVGDNVRPRGAEVVTGMLLIPEGTVLTPGAVALAAAGGNTDVLVTGRPSVALLATYGGGGDPAAAAAAGAASEALLPALFRAAGATTVTTRRIPDTVVSLRSTIDASDADVIVVTGSSTHDRARHLDQVLTDLRVDVALHGARDAAGIADTSAWLLVRLHDGRLLVAMPGELRSCVAAAVTIVRPLVHGLCGYGIEEIASRTLELDVPGDGERSRFVFVRGPRPTPDHGPATGHGVAAADALVLVPPAGAVAGDGLPALTLL